MHPKAHNIALLAALVQLEQCGLPDDQRTGPTMRDLKEALPSMNDREFQTTMKNLRRRDKVRIANTVSVPYCARKVAVYGLYVGDLPKTMGQHAESLALWASMPVAVEHVGLST
jgi:vacuolar-type H+-ATPase catalytic subunit A/Vma1